MRTIPILLPVVFIYILLISAHADITEAVHAYSDMPKNLRAALLDSLKTPSKKNVWIAEKDGFIACAARQSIPSKEHENYEKLHLSALSRTETRTSIEMVFYLAVKQYVHIWHLDNLDLLYTAFQYSQVSGSIKGKLHQSWTANNEVITLAFCPVESIKASLIEPKKVQNIRNNYLRTGHERIKRYFAQNDNASAISIWHHLEDRALISPDLTIDVARCYQKAKQYEECVVHCRKYLQVYSKLDTHHFFMQLGSILTDIPTEEAETLALLAFDKAEALLITPQPVVRTIELPKQ